MSEEHVTRILAVDDEPRILEMIDRYLTSKGYEVITASDGRAALKAANKHHPDIIIMDIVMPDMTGLEALAELKKKRKTLIIPVIMLTGNDDDESIKKALHSYATQYLIKPVPMPVLEEKIVKILSH